MQLITAVVPPFVLDPLARALAGMGVLGLTAGQVHDSGWHEGHQQVYRGAAYGVGFTPGIRIEVVVPDSVSEKVVEVIADTARAGHVGGGVIWVGPVQSLVRIRTGERDTDAL